MRPATFLIPVVSLWAQAPVLENTGKPIQVPVECGEEQIRALGLVCAPACPVYLELSSAEMVANRIFAAGNLHTEATTVESVLLASDDGGATWREPHARLRAGGFDQLQFIDLETGWLSGHTLGTLPRDPFLLVTRDGGKTWYQRPVYPDSRIGLIERYRFESKTHGMLWIDRTVGAEDGDRYEEYESNNGGESWALKRTSPKPLAKPAARPTAPAIRLRPDAGTSSYRVETHTSGRWQPLASFRVRAGECRQPEPVLQPPPEPLEPEAAKPESAKPEPARPPAREP
jgi:photosystem II stability/assembly factor-like uncharacterized protein